MSETVKRKYCDVCGNQMPSNATRCARCELSLKRNDVVLMLTLVKEIEARRSLTDEEFILQAELQDHVNTTKKTNEFKLDCPHYDHITKDSYMVGTGIIGKDWCGEIGEFITKCDPNCARYKEIMDWRKENDGKPR